MLILDLENTSDEDANATLEMKIPEGMVAEVQAVGSVREAQLDGNLWLLNVPSTITPGQLRIILKTLDDHQPGFHKVEAKIVQISG